MKLLVLLIFLFLWIKQLSEFEVNVVNKRVVVDDNGIYLIFRSC